MAAGPWVGASTAHRASLYMSRMEAEARKHNQALHTLKIAKETPTKCACCGSHEFRQHAGRMICTYCRTDGRK